MTRVVLAVDLGTGGPKVGLVSLRGEMLWWEHHPVRTTYGPGGAATQDAEEWWRLVREATRRGLAGAAVRAEDVVAVCVTGQWASTVPVDASGRPVGPCVMWTDTAGEPHSRAVVAGPVQGYRPVALATWIRHSGGVPSTSGADPIGHMLHLEHDRPEVAARARWYLEPVDYLTMRFTGTAAATHMSMTAAWLTDNRHLERLQYDEVLVRRAGVDAAKLPPLVATGSVVGTVSPEVAADLGITPSARVVTGLPDLHGSAMGSGCILEHQAHASIGTTAWVSCPVSAKRTDALHQVATVPGLGDGLYLLGNNQDSAGRCLQWFRENVAPGTGGTVPSYEDVLEAAATAPPGAGGVIFTPWLTGERSPVDDRTARGGFHNVALPTTSADLARAVLEGVALNLRWLLQASEHVVGCRLDPLRIIGGGARSDLWCQVVADVVDRTVERAADPLLCGLRGAALASALALGELTRAEVRSCVPVDRVFVPDPANRTLYDALFAEFPRLYKAERRMFRRLNGAPARTG